MKKISVIIPTHNRERMCKRAIASVLGQTYTNFEIIVSNDSEEDYDTVGSYAFEHPKVRYFKKDPEGYDKNYIFLAEKAEGDYIYCLEDDDYLINNNIFQEVIESIQNKDNVNAVMMGSSLNYRNALTFNKKFKEIYTNTEMFELFPDISTEFQLGFVFFKGSLLKKLIAEEVPKRVGSVNTDAFIFLLCCLEDGFIHHLNKVGYMITVNGDNQSWNNYINSFFGGNSFIQEIAKRAQGLDLNINMWQDKMERNHIEHLLEFFPQYLEEVDCD